MQDKIHRLLSNATALPVFFVGSGLTRRYLGLPNWEGLLREFCVKSPYEYYYNKAERECREHPEMIYPKIADYVEADFNDTYFTESTYEKSREDHAKEIDAKISPFKFCIADFFRDKAHNIQEQYAHEIELFRKIGNKNISCVITTNYDLYSK